MIYFLFLIALCFSNFLAAQQHDSHTLISMVSHMSQSLSQKSSDYLVQAWELYKANNPDNPGQLGNCLDFTVTLSEAVKKAITECENHEKTRPNKITYEYTSKMLALEETKNAIYWAYNLDLLMRVVTMNDACKPKDNTIVNR